jgi:hypothetical protein
MFVIYHIPSTMQVGPTRGGHPHTLYAKTYETRGAALRTMKKFNAREHGPSFIGPGTYGVASYEHYRDNVVKMVTRTNLLSGKEYQEASNTLGCCSPSSETYWSA